jgi:hypothetical protein
MEIKKEQQDVSPLSWRWTEKERECAVYSNESPKFITVYFHKFDYGDVAYNKKFYFPSRAHKNISQPCLKIWSALRLFSIYTMKFS